MLLSAVCTLVLGGEAYAVGIGKSESGGYPAKPIRFIVPYVPGSPGHVSRRPVCGDGDNAARIAAGSGRFREYPTKPIRFIVPYTPGGNTDVLARMIALKLTEAWGQQVIIDNRPGAAGTLGVDMAAKAPPDGYTIVMASFGNILVGPALYKNLPYDPVKDLTPVILVAEPPGILVAHPSVPARSVKELIALAKARPGTLTYGSAGAGASNHLYGELFGAMAGVTLVHVPYKGSAPGVNDLLGGQINLMFAPFPPVTQHIKSGRLRALGVTSLARSPLLPEVPSIAESGIPGYEAVGWFAVLGPAGMPRAVVGALNREIARILALPEVRTNLAADGAEPAGGTPEQLAQSIKRNVAKWSQLVRQLNITSP
jgi:tripartite-type tricarboxylate transporter receptor subunit TctC